MINVRNELSYEILMRLMTEAQKAGHLTPEEFVTVRKLAAKEFLSQSVSD